MDGEHRDCPIVPDETIRLNLSNNDYLLIAAHADSIQMFPDPDLTHLRYYDNDDKQLKAIWLPEDILAELLDRGIPLTMRESITESEMEAYAQYMGKIALASQIAVDPVEQEIAHLDAEIDYYFGHGGIEDL